MTVEDGLDHTTTYTYNDRGEVLTETQPSGGGTTTYTYDLAGRLTSVDDPDDNITTYTYNRPTRSPPRKARRAAYDIHV